MSRENICTLIIYHISKEKDFLQFTHKKKAYTRKYIAQKLINQFFEQVEYPMQQSVCILCVKTIRDMTAKLQEGYKNNAMHVNPKHK